MSMLAMVGFGVSEIFGCFFIGMIVDKLGSRVATIFNVISILLMTGVTMAFVIEFKFNYLAWAMCFLSGVCDSSINTST